MATALALVSAMAHALFGALQKGRHDPWISRAAIDAGLLVITLPTLFLVPPPDAGLWTLLLGSMGLHFGYKCLVALAYERADYTVVYPVIRGTGPLLTVLAAGAVFGESFGAVQWAGVILLSGGILGLAAANLRGRPADPARLRAALGWAGLCGASVAAYTVYDAWGIRSAADPFTFLAWFFFMTALDFPTWAALRWRARIAASARALAARGLLGAGVAWVSFGGVMLATRLGGVGEAAALRETSAVFAAAWGWFLLGERPAALKVALMAVIAAGAVLTQLRL